MEKRSKDKRRILLFIPLLIVPFLALAFYALGGGRSEGVGLPKTSGINTNLPDASFSADTPKTKEDYYNRSAKGVQATENEVLGIGEQLGFEVGGFDNSGSPNGQTKLIDEKLEALNREINRPEPLPQKSVSTNRPLPSTMKNDVDRLEMLMKTMQSNKTEDPEMAQLSGMMQSILDIQHPERVTERQRFARSLSPDSLFRATPAILTDNQKAVQGATIKIRLDDSLQIGTMVIPKGHLIFGSCRITNQRLLVDINNIRLGTSIIPVDLSVYSLDGMIGIAAPEAMLTGALNNGTDDAVRSVGFGGFDNSVGMQVAEAGIDAARQLISKKVKRIKVKLNAGSRILLRNNQLRTR